MDTKLEKQFIEDTCHLAEKAIGFALARNIPLALQDIDVMKSVALNGSDTESGVDMTLKVRVLKPREYCSVISVREVTWTRRIKYSDKDFEPETVDLNQPELPGLEAHPGQNQGLVTLTLTPDTHFDLPKTKGGAKPEAPAAPAEPIQPPAPMLDYFPFDLKAIWPGLPNGELTRFYRTEGCKWDFGDDPEVAKRLIASAQVNCDVGMDSFVFPHLDHEPATLQIQTSVQWYMTDLRHRQMPELAPNPTPSLIPSDTPALQVIWWALYHSGSADAPAELRPLVERVQHARNYCIGRQLYWDFLAAKAGENLCEYCGNDKGMHLYMPCIDTRVPDMRRKVTRVMAGELAKPNPHCEHRLCPDGDMSKVLSAGEFDGIVYHTYGLLTTNSIVTLLKDGVRVMQFPQFGNLRGAQFELHERCGRLGYFEAVESMLDKKGRVDCKVSDAREEEEFSHYAFDAIVKLKAVAVNLLAPYVHTAEGKE